TAIAQSIASDNLRIYPNPVGGQLTLEALNSTEPVAYVLYATDGKQIAQGQFVGSTRINVAMLKAGIYTLKVVQDSKVAFYKVVKQ
ncbi:MAG: T9SS type A sorting domain-containing protein, partial [Bacteroidales bacterium]